jgi:hypothetical protein
MPVTESHRERAIVLLAREISIQSPPNESALRAAAGIVDAITEHAVETHQALLKAEAKLEEGVSQKR